MEAFAEDNSARITWSEPGPEDVLFSFVTANTTSYLIGASNSNIEVVHRYAQGHLEEFGVSGAELTEVHFLTGPQAVLQEVNIIIYTAPPGYEQAQIGSIPRTIVHGQNIPLVSLIQSGSVWNEIILTESVSIPTEGELWISINYLIIQGNPGATDSGPSVAGFSNVMKLNQGFGDGWGTLQSMAGANYSWMIRGYAANVIRGDEISYNRESRGGLFGFSDFESRIKTGNVDVDAGGTPALPVSIIPVSKISSKLQDSSSEDRLKFNIRNTRSLESFSIWRSGVDVNNNILPESEWIFIVSDITDFEFIDYSWLTVDEGRYRYGVRAVYTNQIYSDIRWSNDVYKNLDPVFMPPRNFTGNQIVGTFDVSLSWSEPEFTALTGPPTGYKLVRDTNEPIIITSLSHTDLELPIGIYQYSLLAIYIYEESPAVEITVIVDELPVFMPPNNFVGVQIENSYSVELSWEEPNYTPVTGAPTGYRLTRNDDEPIELSELSYIDTNLSVGNHIYSLVAVYEGEDGVFVGDSIHASRFIVGDSIHASRSTSMSIRSFESPPVQIDVNIEEWVVYMPPRNFVGFQINATYNIFLSWEPPDFMEFTGPPTSYKIIRDAEEPFHVLGLSYTQNVYEAGDYIYTLSAYYGLIESESIEIVVHTDFVSEIDNPLILETALKGNYPNPFNPSTTISYDIKEEGHVRIEVFNIRGQRIITLVDEPKRTGSYTIDWLGFDEMGKPVSSGVYMYQMRAEGYSKIQRMILMK